eukprot:gene7429-1171_t
MPQARAVAKLPVLGAVVIRSALPPPAAAPDSIDHVDA